MKKSAISQQIIICQSVMNQKRYLMTIILEIKPKQMINKLYNARSRIMKELRMIMSV